MAQPLDLMSLDSPKRFQAMCFQLAKTEFRGAQAVNFASWDGGADIIQFWSPGTGDVIWQCKFTHSLGSNTRKAVGESLRALDERQSTGRRAGPTFTRTIGKWILCLPVDPTNVFLDWLRAEIGDRRFEWEVWGQSELLRRLDLPENRNVLESFFYGIYSGLRDKFRTDELELLDLRVDPKCEWLQPDQKVLHFCAKGNVDSPDLLLDLVVRNLGEVETALTGLLACVTECSQVLHGVPGDALLKSKITYKVWLS